MGQAGPNPKVRIPDVREWTSLCLFHDYVIVWTPNNPTEENEILAKQATFEPLSKSKLAAETAFNNILTQFSEGEAVRLLTLVELRKLKLPRSDLSRIIALKKTKENMLPVRETFGMISSYAASKHYGCPIISDDSDFHDLGDGPQSAEVLSQVFGDSAICQLALPDVRAVRVEDVLQARGELKNELLEFRAGMLKLTWLLHQQVQNKNDLEEITQEADVLTNTIIKGSLLSLENRMRQHKNKCIRRMLLGTGKVLVEATKVFLPGGAAEKMIAGGKSLFELATELDSTKPPEDQVAMYLYRLRDKFKEGS